MYTLFAYASPKIVDVDKMRESLKNRTRIYSAEGVLHIHSKSEDCGDKCERYLNGEKVKW